MKSFIFIAVLAALAVYNDAASVPEVVAPYNEEVLQVEESVDELQKDYLPEGAISRQLRDSELILLYEEIVLMTAVPNAVLERNIVFNGNSTTQINRITISNPPTVPGHTFIGNYWTHAHVRLTSPPGVGLRSTVRFFGRYTDWL